MEATPKIDSPYMVPKRSQLGQLPDLTEKGVSQQTIVIDNFNTRRGDIMTSIKQVTAMSYQEAGEHDSAHGVYLDQGRERVGGGDQFHHHVHRVIQDHLRAHRGRLRSSLRSTGAC
jgi:hypothetical protein